MIGILVGVAVAAGGLTLAFFLSSPSAPSLPIDVETKPLPRRWTEPDAVSEAPALDAAAEVSLTETPEPYVSTGSLALIGNGKPFGEESYRLTIGDDRATLRSSGRFWFHVVLATVYVTFEQTFEGDGDLRPVMYVAEFHAPLGFDRSVQATIEDDLATVERSGETQQFAVEPERTFALGTFSTYVLLPRLFQLRREDGSATFEVLVFGGPPDQASDVGASGDDLPVMTVTRNGSATLVAGDVLLDVDCYHVSSDLGESELFAREDEFLAFRAGTGDESLMVYRSDFFPDGVEIQTVTSLR